MFCTQFLQDIIKLQLSFIKSIDKDLEQSYKKNMWLLLNELEKPYMRSVFENGRAWRTLKQEFLTVDGNETM